MSDMDDIYIALTAAESLAESAVWNAKGCDARDNAKWRRDAIQRGQKAYNRLSAEMPRLRDLKTAADREYDRHVTRFRDEEPQGCSCHISPPCGFCTSQSDEEEAA